MDKANTVLGTPYYLSPEIIDHKPYDFASDIWSLGIILYELCSLKPPFRADSLPALGLKIVTGIYEPIPNYYSKELRDLVKQLIVLDPMKRPTINAILSKCILNSRKRFD